MSKNIAQISLAVVLACYPLIVYFGLETLPLKWVAGLILALFVLRLLLLGKAGLQVVKSLGVPVAACGVVLTSASLLFDSDQSLLLYPVLVSLTCLCVFAATLFSPPSMIERFARLTEEHLPDEAITYTRKVTLVWCMFFVINAGIAAYTVVLDDPALWALYNGLISYLLMGSLLGGEWCFRKWILNV